MTTTAYATAFTSSFEPMIGSITKRGANKGHPARVTRILRRSARRSERNAWRREVGV